MAVIEKDGLYQYIDENGNIYILYPVTKLDNVSGTGKLVHLKDGTTLQTLDGTNIALVTSADLEALSNTANAADRVKYESGVLKTLGGTEIPLAGSFDLVNGLKIEIIKESKNWVAPKAKDQRFRVFAVGAGGGYNTAAGGGGGGGYVEIDDITIAENTTVSVVCGAFSPTGDGGTTTFGSYLTANGGKRATSGQGGHGGAGGGGFGSGYGDKVVSKGGNGGTYGGGGGGGSNGNVTGGKGGNGGNGGTYGGGGGGGGDYKKTNYGAGGTGGTYGGAGSSKSSSAAKNGTPPQYELFRSLILFAGLSLNDIASLQSKGETSDATYGTGGGGGGYGGNGGNSGTSGDGGGGGGGFFGNGGNSGTSAGGGGGGGGGFFSNGGIGNMWGGGGGGFFHDGGGGGGANSDNYYNRGGGFIDTPNGGVLIMYIAETEES